MGICWIFPGQGAQYVGMGKSFFEGDPLFRQTVEEAEDLLKLPLKSVMLSGPEEDLTLTRNSQLAIYVMSVGIWRRVVKDYLSDVEPVGTCGLSLGEYSAMTASSRLPFEEGVKVVEARGRLMTEACRQNPGGMAVILGLQPDSVRQIVKEIDGLWAANFNCPGQIVISGTQEGILLGKESALEAGAKKALDLDVSGAFHSGLMAPAESAFRPVVEKAFLQKGICPVAMNAVGKTVEDLGEIRENLILQVTHSVLWQSDIETFEPQTTLFLEMGPGKTLAGLNKRIKVQGKTLSIDALPDLDQLAAYLKENPQ